MADFNKAIPKILKAEGGYTRNPNDLGNYQCESGWAKREGDKFVCKSGKFAHLTGTNRGIAAPTLNAWKGRPVTDSEMKHLTEDEAKKIYKAIFWNKIKGDAITEQSKAEVLFDAYVNQTGWVRIMLADTLNIDKNSISYPIPATVIKKINTSNNFVSKFVKERKKRYVQTSERAGQAGFLKGWLNRLEEFETGKSIMTTIKKNKIATAIISFSLITGIILLIKHN